MKSILVTGGLGYIGSHTAVDLIARGYGVVLADNLNNSRAEVLDGIEAISGVRPEWVQVDLADRSATEAFLAGRSFDGIIHFAAHKAVGESVTEPIAYYRNNLNALLNLLDYQRAKPSCGLIFSSSCTVYGQADALPIPESAPIKPAESPYGNTKQVGEEILRDAVRAFGLKVSMVIVDDDVALPDLPQARGVAGTLFVHKIAGALAEAGADLDTVTAAAHAVIKGAISIGMSLDTCTVPGSPKEDRIATGKAEDKFGVSFAEAARLYANAANNAALDPVGVACHIGSQISDLAPMREAFTKMVGLVRSLRARHVEEDE